MMWVCQIQRILRQTTIAHMSHSCDRSRAVNIRSHRQGYTWQWRAFARKASESALASPTVYSHLLFASTVSKLVTALWTSCCLRISSVTSKFHCRARTSEMKTEYFIHEHVTTRYLSSSPIVNSTPHLSHLTPISERQHFSHHASTTLAGC